MLNLVRIVLIVLWSILAAIFGIVIAVFRWGDPDTNHAFAGLLGRGGLRIAGIRVELEGAEHLREHHPCVFVANHQSSLDILTFGVIYPRRTAVIAKRELAWVPFLGIYIAAAGNIFIKRQSRTSAFESLNKAARTMRKRGASVWLFAEGTRNKAMDGTLLPFKKGAFRLAIQAQVPVVGVVSSRLDRVLERPSRKIRGGVVRIRALPPIPTTGLTDRDADRLIADVRQKMELAIAEISISTT